MTFTKVAKQIVLNKIKDIIEFTEILSEELIQVPM